MEDLIVIIIMIAISVVGALTRSKKKRGAIDTKKPSQPQSKAADFWETLFEEGKPAEPVFATEPIVKEQEPVAPVKEITPEPVLFEEGSPQRMDKIKEDEIKIGEIGSQQNTSKILEGFSLKKAVVFSEIINQKYF